MKKTGAVYKGEAKPKPDVTIILADDVLVELAEGKVSIQRTRSNRYFLTSRTEAQRSEGLLNWQAEDQRKHHAGNQA
jgi:hypothetical protein